MFKSGAVRIEKSPIEQDGLVKIHAKEQQSAAIKKVQQNKAEADKVTTKQDRSNNVRRLELWLGATFEALKILSKIYEDIIPKLVHDLEVIGGLQVMQRITQDIIDKLKPEVEKYGESINYGRSVAGDLRVTLFPELDQGTDPYEALTALQGLEMYITYIDGHLTALGPASQAMWDQEFVDAVFYAQSCIARESAWVKQHIKVKSPQTLLVPSVLAEHLRGDPSKVAWKLHG